MSDRDTTEEPSQEPAAADTEETTPGEGAETDPVEGDATVTNEGDDAEASQPIESEPVPEDADAVYQSAGDAEEQEAETTEQPVESAEEQAPEAETTEQPVEAEVSEQPAEAETQEQADEAIEQAADAEPTEQPAEAEPTEQAAGAEPTEQAAGAEPTEQAAGAEPTEQADEGAEEPPTEAEPSEPAAEGAEEQADKGAEEQAAEGAEEQAVEAAEEQAAEAEPTEQPTEAEPTEQPADAEPTEQAAEAEQPAVEAEPTEVTVEGTETTKTPAAETEKKDETPIKKEKSEQRTFEYEGCDVPIEIEKKDEPLAEDTSKEKKHVINLNANATVKFVLMPSGQVVTLACTLGQTLKQLKDHFATELKMPYNLILLMYDGKGMNDNTTLADLGVGPNGTVQLEMQSADPVNTPIKAYRPRQEYHMPDVITVRVQADDGNPHEVIVEIERTTRKKPYLGGYRHKDTGVEFHNASAQTMPKPKPPSHVELFCRDTQTVQQRHGAQQTFNDMATQMTKIGVYVSNMTDKLIIPNKYTTADEHLASILGKIIIIQKYYRRWLAKTRVKKLRDDKKRRLEWERQEELRKRKEKEDRIKKEFARRMNPKNKDDFDLLYHALEKWRNEELDRINSTLTGAERKAALYMLLDQETQLLAAIDRHKLEADDSNRQLRILTFLDKAASPKTWKGRDGKATKMDTPYTIRARELKDIYNSINMKYLTQDERLDVLLTLKHTVKEHDCKLTQEIIELIDREADLLMRGVKETNLDGLRKRISTLFLQYIKTPTFNPEAAKLLKVPQDPSSLRKNIYYCTSCNNYLPSTEFPLSSNSRNVSKCRHCNKVDNDGRIRQDYSHYRYMLRMLRRSEEAYEDHSQIAFLLQESDLRYLVENIWNSQSILSAWEDLFDLVLVRWNRHEEWSPWNCILLTKDEAAAHDKLHSLEEGYGSVFIHKVKQKHTLAKNYFSRLPGMAEVIRQKITQKDMSGGPSVAGKSVPVQQKA